MFSVTLSVGKILGLVSDALGFRVLRIEQWCGTDRYHLIIDYSAPLQAIHIILESEENMSIKCHELSEAQLKALEDVRELSNSTLCKKLYPLKKTPTLSIVVPLYERLLHLFRRGTKFLGFPMHLSRSSRNILPTWKHAERIGSMCSPWVRRNHCTGVTTPDRCWSRGSTDPSV